MLTKAETLKLIKSIAIRGKHLDNDIQKAAIASIFYSVCHGDVTIGAKLLESFPAGSRKAALVEFLEKFGQFRLEQKTFLYNNRLDEIVKFGEFDGKFRDLLENAELSEAYCDSIKVHWTSCKPEHLESRYDCMESVKRLISKMEKEISKNNAVNSEVFDAISAAFNTYCEAKDATEEDEQEEEEIMQEDLRKVVNM